MSHVDKETVINNFVWRLFERVGAQGVTFIVSIILARILDPEVYGAVALLTVFTTILQVFIDGGLGNALIQKPDADDIDFSSVFYINVIFCILLYVLIYVLSPIISFFYSDSLLTPLMRVLALTVIISGIKNVQQAYVSRKLLFKRFFFSTLGGTIGAAIIGVWMAYRGYGAWAIVIQNVFNQLIDTVILWITVKWRPKRVFSLSRVRIMFSFGWKLLLARLLDTVYIDLQSLIIGKRYTTSDLAYYDRGVQFPKLIIINLNAALTSVLFPVMSREQGDKETMKKIVQRSILVNCYILFPLMMGLAVCATPLIRVLLTEKWLPCVPYLRIFCFNYAFVAFNTCNQNSYQAMGRSDIYLKNEALCKVIGLAFMLGTIWISVYVFAFSTVFATIITSFINANPNKKLISYGFMQQLKDMSPNILLTTMMGIVVYLISFIPISPIIILIIQIFIGFIVYVVGSILIHLDIFFYLLRVARSYI